MVEQLLDDMQNASDQAFIWIRRVRSLLAHTRRTRNAKRRKKGPAPNLDRDCRGRARDRDHDRDNDDYQHGIKG